MDEVKENSDIKESETEIDDAEMHERQRFLDDMYIRMYEQCI